MIQPPTQQLLSCSFGHPGWVEFPERLCGPDLGEDAHVLVECESDGVVQSESPTSLLGDGTREDNTRSSSMKSTYFLSTFLRSNVSAESLSLTSNASLFLSV